MQVVGVQKKLAHTCALCAVREIKCLNVFDNRKPKPIPFRKMMGGVVVGACLNEPGVSLIL